jgi:hypothetical protein
MILIVGGLLLFILRNPGSEQIPQIIGSFKGGGVGFVAMLVVLYKIIRVALEPGATRRERRPRKENTKSTSSED